MIFGLMGVLALVPYARASFLVLAALLSIRALWWHARRERTRFILSRRSKQARRGLAGLGWLGTAYFGWILGTTAFTQMTTPVVQALAALTAAEGVQFGLAAGVGLGVARSFEAWQGAFSRGTLTPAVVVARYANGGSSVIFRVTGLALAITILAVDVLVTAR